jgi:ubiquinone/menaquinone biosynthesis C-methylase UbiE
MSSFRRKCFRLYWRAQRAIAPDLDVQDAQVVYENTLDALAGSSPHWLDLGCGHQVLQEWRGDAERALVGKAGVVVGLDLEHEALKRHRTIARRTRGDLSNLPFADGTFDLVTANMVLEHLREPATQLSEIARVLKPGGVFVGLTPNRFGYQATLARCIPEPVKRSLVWMLQARAAHDLFPTYYRVNTSATIEQLAKRAGFSGVAVEHVLSHAQFAVVLPLAVLELLFIRALMGTRLRHLRPNLVIRLVKARDQVAPAECVIERTRSGSNATRPPYDARPREYGPSVGDAGWCPNES